MFFFFFCITLFFFCLVRPILRRYLLSRKYGTSYSFNAHFSKRVFIHFYCPCVSYFSYILNILNLYVYVHVSKKKKSRRLTVPSLTLSANIRAPASMTNSWDSSSLTTAAVRPAALLALPLVYTALGLNSSTCLKRQITVFILQ